MSNTAKATTIVLGAGLMGRLLSLELLKRGHQVALYDAQGPDGSGSAALVAAAMLAPMAESAITEMGVVQMGRHGLKRWPEMINQLPQHVFFQQKGTLILWHMADGHEADRFHQLIDQTHEREPALEKALVLNAQGIDTLEPTLKNRCQRGLFLPSEGQLDTQQLLRALQEAVSAFEAQGQLEMHWHESRSPEQFELQSTNAHGSIQIFDCRGLGAKPQWNGLRGVRGEVIRIHAPGVQLSRPTRLIHPRYPLYIAPKEDDLYVIGATEIEVEDSSEASVRSTLELLSAAYSLHPAFAEGRIVQMNTQNRPTLTDNLPCIDLSTPNVMKINGLYRHGFLIAPAMLDCAMEWLDHQSLNLAQTFNLRVIQ
jgi:glycine oxidase